MQLTQRCYGFRCQFTPNACHLGTISFLCNPAQCTSFSPIDWRQYCCDGDVTAVVISRISLFSRAWIFCTLKHTTHTHTDVLTHMHPSTHPYTHIHQSIHAHCATSLLSCLHVFDMGHIGPGTLCSRNTSVLGHIGPGTGTLQSWDTLILGHIGMTPSTVIKNAARHRYQTGCHSDKIRPKQDSQAATCQRGAWFSNLQSLHLFLKW